MIHRDSECPWDTERKADYPSDRSDLTGISIEVRDQPIEFILCWAAVSLLAFANEPKPLQSDAGEIIGSTFTGRPCTAAA